MHRLIRSGRSGQSSVRTDRTGGNEVAGLEDESHPVPTQDGEVVVVACAEVLVTDGRRTGHQRVQPSDAVQERRLPRAGRAHDRRELPGRELGADIVEGTTSVMLLP